MPCGECDRLRAQVRELKEELAEWEATDGEVLDSTAQDLARRLRVRTQAAKMALYMMSFPDQTISNDRLARAIGYGKDGDPRKSVSVATCHLRKAGIPVVNVWGQGQRLSREGAARVRALL